MFRAHAHSLTSILFAFVAIITTGASATQVNISLTLVSDELQLRPVPKHTMEIHSGDSLVQSLSSGIDGTATVDLTPGSYIIKSVQPVNFQGASYQWHINFNVGTTPQKLELSSDNAQRVGFGSNAPTAADVFQKVEKGVVTIETEISHGSGFLVDASGLILTNDHVIAGSRYFVVEFDPLTRYRAVIVASNPTADLAIIAVHPDTVNALPVIPLAKDSLDNPAAQVGETVFAIGSPLNQSKIVTSGIVSKNESDVIISDVNINPGNSGGPLLNVYGEAIGVNTFRDPAPGGPGISGVLRIWKAIELLNQAKQKIPDATTLSNVKLPTYPKDLYPVEELRRIVMTKEFDLNDYKLSMRRFDLYLLTPPASCYMQHQTAIEIAKGREKRRKNDKVQAKDLFDPLGDMREWVKYTGDLKPVVSVLIEPKIRATAGSQFAAALLGTSSVLRYEFRADFDTIRLINNGKVMQPIRVGRNENSLNFKEIQGRMQDAAYGGFAEYLPEAFDAAGGKIYFEVYDEDDPGKARIQDIPVSILKRIQEDFKVMRRN